MTTSRAWPTGTRRTGLPGAGLRRRRPGQLAGAPRRGSTRPVGAAAATLTSTSDHDILTITDRLFDGLYEHTRRQLLTGRPPA